MRRALILLYHRIADLVSDPFENAVSPKHFAEHLEVLRTFTRPIPLQKLGDFLQEPGGGRPAAVVTFDDGYADTLYHARPLLERYEVPATVFLTTGLIGREREFWWDALERVLLQPGKLPETFRLTLHGHAFQWELSDSADYAGQRHAAWNLWTSKDDPTPRHRLFRVLYQILRSLSSVEQRRFMEGLFEWAGIEPAPRSTHRVLSPSEVPRLADGELIEVGAHTVSHPTLSRISAAEQRTEIEGSKFLLEELVGRPVKSFGYPFGRPGDYTPETVSIVRELGFVLACSNIPGMVLPGADTFQLPRHHMIDEDSDAVARWLREQL